MNIVSFKLFAYIGILTEMFSQGRFGIDIKGCSILHGQFVKWYAVNGQRVILVEKVLSCFHIVQGNVGKLPGRMPKGALSDSGSSVSGSGKD